MGARPPRRTIPGPRSSCWTRSPLTLVVVRDRSYSGYSLPDHSLVKAICEGLHPEPFRLDCGEAFRVLSGRDSRCYYSESNEALPTAWEKAQERRLSNVAFSNFNLGNLPPKRKTLRDSCPCREWLLQVLTSVVRSKGAIPRGSGGRKHPGRTAQGAEKAPKAT